MKNNIMFNEDGSFLNYPFLEIKSQLQNFEQTIFNTNSDNISLLINNGGRLAQNLIEYVYMNKKDEDENIHKYTFKDFLDKKCRFIPKHLRDSALYFEEKRYDALNSVEYNEEIEDVFFTYLEAFNVFLYLFGNYLCNEFNNDAEKFISLYDTTEFIQDYINVERRKKHLTNSNGFNLNSETSSRDIYKMLKSLDSKIDALSEKVDDRANGILDEIGKLDEKLEIYNASLAELKESVQNKLEAAEGNEHKKEKIYNKFNHDAAVKIRDNVEDCVKGTDEYDEAVENIKDKIGLTAWNKLDERSQRFLTTSKISYKYLCELGDNVDYSGVCLSATKALELELRARFIDGFLDYLDSEYELDYPVYHTSFYTYDRYKDEYYRIREGDKTLGTIPHILGSTDKSKKLKSEKRENNTSKLLEYSWKSLFDENKHNSIEIETTLRTYGSKINSITDRFRNTSAHIDRVERKKAKKCLDELINNKDNFLKTMLNSFDKEKPKYSN